MSIASTSLDRRSFLKGAALAGAGTAAFGLGSYASVAQADEVEAEAEEEEEVEATEEEAAEETAETSSYLTAPDPVDDSLITETIETDVVIIGTGVSGLCLADRLAELGVDFRIFSAGTTHVQRGGSIHGINTTVQQAYGIDDYTPENLAHRIKQEIMANSYFIDQRKWSKWYNNCEEAVNWMIEKCESYGGKFVLELGYNDEDYLWDFTPASHNFIMTDESLTTENGGIFSYTTDYGAYAGAALINDIYQYEVEQVVPIDFSTKAEYLIRDDDNTGRVSAVVAQKLDENGEGTGEYVKYIGNKGIVMATGDFSQNQEMLADHCPWVLEHNLISDVDVNYDATFTFGGLMPGDGQKMGLWVGAAWQKAPYNAPMIDCLDGPYTKEISNVTTINLNKNGKRYMNEDCLCSYSALAGIQQPDQVVYYIWPEELADKNETWNQFGATVASPDDGIQYPSYCSYTPDEMREKWASNAEQGTYVSGSTVQEVLEALGDIDVDAALETIEQYNQYCQDGYDPEFLKSASELDEIVSESGVYYGYRCEMDATRFLCITGGLRTNDDMQVCDENDEPIEGLYNIGVMVGDMFANCYNFAICGHSLSATCTTFPYLLAQDFANM